MLQALCASPSSAVSVQRVLLRDQRHSGHRRAPRHRAQGAAVRRRSGHEEADGERRGDGAAQLGVQWKGWGDLGSEVEE